MNKIKFKIAITSYVFLFVSLVFLSCYEPPESSREIEKSQFDLTFKEIIQFDWATKLTDLPNIFPGGEIRRMDPKIRTLSFYSIKANLTDIDEIADLTFHQNEEYIRGQSKDVFNIRRLYFDCTIAYDQKAKFEYLCAHVNSLDSKVYTTVNPKHADASYGIYDADGKGGINIDIDMNDKASSKRCVEINITRFVINKL